MATPITQRVGIQPELRTALSEYGSVGVPWGLPVNAVASTAPLTVAVNPTAGDTFTVGDITYTFVANGTAPLLAGMIELEALLAGTQPSIVLAINGGDGHNAANASASAGAFAADVSTLTATVAGVVGDSIAVAETFADPGNTLTAFINGVDGTPGIQGAVAVDAGRIYVCIATQGTEGANWRRIANALVAL